MLVVGVITSMFFALTAPEVMKYVAVPLFVMGTGIMWTLNKAKAARYTEIVITISVLWSIVLHIAPGVTIGWDHVLWPGTAAAMIGMAAHVLYRWLNYIHWKRPTVNHVTFGTFLRYEITAGDKIRLVLPTGREQRDYEICSVYANNEETLYWGSVRPWSNWNNGFTRLMFCTLFALLATTFVLVRIQ